MVAKRFCCDDPRAYLDGFAQKPVPDTLSTKELGELGEKIACSYLMVRGYDIIEWGYRCVEGEADIIAYDTVEEAIVLVEVKTRRVPRAALETFPEEAVDAGKQRRYRRIASCYVLEHYPVPAIRFDVVAVRICDGMLGDIEHIYSAFDWEGAR